MSSLPLPGLYRRCPSAATVLLHLIEAAGAAGRPTITTSRTRICEATGITDPDTVTAALKALAAAGVVKYRAPALVKSDSGPQGRYLKITLLKTRLNRLSEMMASLWKTRLNRPSEKCAHSGKPGSTGLPLYRESAHSPRPLARGGALVNNTNNNGLSPQNIDTVPSATETVPSDPKTRVSLPIALTLAQARGDRSEVERLNQVIAALPNDQRQLVDASLPPQPTSNQETRP